MKIGLNATCFNDRPSGARQRFVGIYGELVRCMPDAEFVMYEPADVRVASWFEGAPNVSARRTPVPSEGRVKRIVTGLTYWRSALSTERLDVFECFSQPAVRAPTGRTLLTIHDIRRVHHDWPPLDRAIYRAALSRDLKAADHVITVSEAMKEEILGFHPGVPVSVIYNGLDTEAFDAVSLLHREEVRKKYALPNEFILAVGHLERRKNYVCLVDAIARLRDQGRSCCLVIVGNDSGDGAVIQERVESAGLTGAVRFLSGLSDLEVRCVYILCNLFVFPSSYEGFGIPILEAMAAGRPMVLSDIPVFREITQDRGVYFPFDDADAIASAIEAVLSSDSARARLVEYGHERVRAFSFQNMARQLAGLYQTLI